MTSPRPRFSLRALLVLTLAVAGFFGGYRWLCDYGNTITVTNAVAKEEMTFRARFFRPGGDHRDGFSSYFVIETDKGHAAGPDTLLASMDFRYSWPFLEAHGTKILTWEGPYLVTAECPLTETKVSCRFYLKPAE